MPAAYLKAPDNFTLIQRCHKVPYESRQALQRVLNRAGMRNQARVGLVQHGTGLHATYRCCVCGKWHYGHLG